MTTGLDGGGIVAADKSGNVYVAWHGVNKGERGEENRKLWVARSTDDGKTFAQESPAWKKETGACACCGVGAMVDSQKAVYVLYRSATDEVNRDTYLLSSTDEAQHFEGVLVHKWTVPG
jgi:hypothetical protein